MKKLLILLITILLLFTSVGCESTTYEEARSSNDMEFFGEYFTLLYEWGSPSEGWYYVMYANDTGVKYMYFHRGYRGGITPLYNADGTLQIYENLN